MINNANKFEILVMSLCIFGTILGITGIFSCMNEYEEVVNFYNSKNAEDYVSHNITVKLISENDMVDTNNKVWALNPYSSTINVHVKSELNTIKSGDNLIIITKDIKNIFNDKKYTLLKIYKINGNVSLSWDNYKG